MRTQQFLGVFHRLLEVIARGILLLVAFIRGPAQSQPPIKDLTLLHSATTLALKIRNRELTSEDVVSSYIERIKEIQPILNCVVAQRFEEALKEARKCDELLKSQDAPSVEFLAKEKPLFGIPFTTKDCIAVKNMRQTAGLVVRKNTVADKDAEVIKLMRSAGAIPLALTNVSELAMWWESSNYLFGTSKNPYNTRHIVGGSSGGEGCIQAAAASPLGIGSDIGGSIRMPAFFNGIFGHKPSKGIVSNDGQYPSAHSYDQDQLLAIGPMCRFAQDLTLILKIISDKNADLLKLNQKVDISKIKEWPTQYPDILGEDGVFLYPTHPTAAPMHNEPLFKAFNFSYTAIVNVLGLPATACPLGLNKQGLPIGIQVVAGLYQDHLTLAVAEELERGFGGWVPLAIQA
ncbi:hypothetical protein PUN28_004536 [Cardiocondyla obscurior]|uniref:Amidase domain-containing protein n=1 Tax=Cardiocondyla obscurior TaxID=286306 RepID=A0AAW2GDX6_9HYME